MAKESDNQPTLTFRDMAERLASKYGERTAVQNASHENDKLSFKELGTRALKAATLMSKYVGKGDLIAICAPNSINHVEIFLGASKIGAIFSSLTQLLSIDQMVNMMKEFEVRILFIHSSYADKLAQVKLLSNLKVFIIDDDQEGGYLDQMKKIDIDVPKVTLTGTDIMFVLFTSGTTGVPKAVIYTHQMILSLGFGPFYMSDDPYYYLVVSAFSWFTGTIASLRHLMQGATLIVYKECPTNLFDEMIKYKAKHQTLTGQKLRDLGDLPDEKVAAMKEYGAIISYGGNTFPLSVVEKALRRFLPEVMFYQGYGSSEAGMVSFLSHKDHLLALEGKQLQRLRSAGKPLFPTEVVIMDENGTILPPNAVGDICIRSVIMTPGYYRNSAATKKLYKNGYLHLGDIGYYDAEGFLFVLGRQSDQMISRDSWVVSLVEVEVVLTDLEGIEQCVSGPVYLPGDEAPWIGVFIKPHKRPNDIHALKTLVIEHSKNHLPETSIPDLVYVLEKFPGLKKLI